VKRWSLLVVLAAVTTLLAGCSSTHKAVDKNHLIVLDHSIGGVSDRFTRPQVERVLGKSVSATRPTKSDIIFRAIYRPRIMVWYVGGPGSPANSGLKPFARKVAHVWDVRTTSPEYRTSSGVGSGRARERCALSPA
jgi:hypothetical protein